MHDRCKRKKTMISLGQIRGQRRLQTAESHGKTKLPQPMSSKFRGISLY